MLNERDTKFYIQAVVLALFVAKQVWPVRSHESESSLLYEIEQSIAAALISMVKAGVLYTSLKLSVMLK